MTNTNTATPMTEKSSSTKVNAAIKAVSRTAGAYNAAVQTAIVLIIQHSAAFGDCTGAARLLAAMPRSNRRSLVIAHFADYSDINVRKEGETFKASLRKPDDKKYNKPNPEGAAANNWWERPEAGSLPDVIDLNAIKGDFDNFIKRELAKADKVTAEAEALPEGAERVNRLNDAAEIRTFVTRIRDMVHVASKPTTSANDSAAPAGDDQPLEKAA